MAPFHFGRKQVLVCAPGDRHEHAQSNPELHLPRCGNTIRSFIMMVTSYGVRDFSSRCDDQAAAPAFEMRVESWTLDRRFSLFPGTSLALVACSLDCQWNSGLCRRVPSETIKQVDMLPSLFVCPSELALPCSKVQDWIAYPSPWQHQFRQRKSTSGSLNPVLLGVW